MSSIKEKLQQMAADQDFDPQRVIEKWKKIRTEEKEVHPVVAAKRKNNNG